MSVFDQRNETMSQEQMSLFQIERLQALIARLKRNVRRYREQLGDLQITSLSELASLPATEPDDLVHAFPYGMFALPLREVIRLHSIVGPGGHQIVIGHTRNDLTNWGRLVARQFVAADITAHDVIQIYFAGGGFESAFGYMQGAEAIEASVVPEDPFHIEYQLATLQNYRVTVLVTSPANAQYLAEVLESKRIDPESLALRTIVLSRPISGEARAQLQSRLFAKIHCSFGVNEVIDPGLCVECTHGHLHVNEDQFLVESRDGELLVTTLYREAMPLLRYATRVSCTLERLDCPCGRTGVTLRPGKRLDDQILVNETPLYPAQIADVLAATPAAGHAFSTEISERRIIISLQLTNALFDDTIRSLVDLKAGIESEFLTRLGIDAQVRFRETLDM